MAGRDSSPSSQQAFALHCLLPPIAAGRVAPQIEVFEAQKLDRSGAGGSFGCCVGKIFYQRVLGEGCTRDDKPPL